MQNEEDELLKELQVDMLAAGRTWDDVERSAQHAQEGKIFTVEEVKAEFRKKRFGN